MRGRVVIMWPINSCDLIEDIVCVVDTMIFERYVVNNKNKHDIFYVETRTLPVISEMSSSTPPIFCDLFQRCGAVVLICIFISMMCM